MEKIPVFARGVAKTAIHRYAIEKGHTIISNTVVDSAVGDLLPKGAMDAMHALGGSLDAAGIDREKMQADESVMKDLMGSTLSGMMTEVVEEKPKVSAGYPSLFGPDEPELLRLRWLRLHRKGRDTCEVPCLRRRRRSLQTGRQDSFLKQRRTWKGFSKPTWPTMTSPCNGRKMPKRESVQSQPASNVGALRPKSRRLLANLA